MKNKMIGFIGCGNMGKAMLGSLISSGEIRKEISIMKYVGATNSFIRWPFLVEGIIIGVVAGAISVGIIGLAYTYIVGQISGTSFFEIANIKFIEFSSMSELLILVYLGLGIGVGAIGSTISMKKYLEV